MLRDFIPAVEGMGIIQISGLLLFFSFFIVLVIWVLKMDKKFILKMERLPLDRSNLENNLPGEKNEKTN